MRRSAKVSVPLDMFRLSRGVRRPNLSQKRCYDDSKKEVISSRRYSSKIASSNPRNQGPNRPNLRQQTTGPTISLKFGFAMMLAGLLGWIYYPKVAEYEDKYREERKRQVETSQTNQ
ncbi:hypothetical protein M408DRAFT_333292 [Serendipita vermifera MAFF 305830]|uniref:Uncharacterized protein n=1 Tax=Serendipita vermifera MAFF 305830 TaxID=933852 RepID=A0A0C2WWL0_SERVB|nr:hypothetical protein M408DRAFT_333292 [Serendipita vermifera MAFF 305830]